MLNTVEDETFKEIEKTTTKDREIASEVAEEIFNLLKAKIEDNNNEFGLKHGFLALSGAITTLTQPLCNDEEDYMNNIMKGNDIALNKIVKAIIPESEEAYENADADDFSIKRLLMATSCLIDYLFWRTEVSEYSARRREIEEAEEVELLQTPEIVGEE